MYQLILSIILLLFHTQDAKIVVSNKDYLLMPDLFHLDNYDRCMLYEDRALYCKLTFQLALLPAQNTTKAWSTIEKVSSEPSNYRHDLLRHGVCIPDTCPHIRAHPTETEKIKDDLTRHYHAKYSHLGLTGHITHLHCENNESPYPIGAGHVIFLVILALYAALSLFSSLYEGVARYTQTKESYERMAVSRWGGIICAFSITRNWIRFTSVDESSEDVRYFRFIQGIRFYNMALVILAHTAMINLAVPVSNPLYAETLTDKAFTVVLGSGALAMQTAFAMSGCLLTYGMLKTFDNQAKIPFSFMLVALLHRIVRLSPVLILVWAFKSTWLVHLSNGPLWAQFIGEDYRRCRQNGWSNLLYINNYVNHLDMCMGHTWYLTNDMEYFIITMLIIKYIKGNENRFYGVVAVILGLNVGFSFYTLYVNEWEHLVRPEPELMYNIAMLADRKWHIVFASNYFNWTGLVGGVVLGYIMYKTQKTKLFTTKASVFWWWMVTWGMGLSITVVPSLISYADDFEPNRLYNALYGSVNKVFFIVSVVVGLVGFGHGVGWCFLWTINWKPMYMLGRLSYGAFIVHETVQKGKAAIKRELNYLSDVTISSEAVEDLCLSYLVALVLHLLLELPVSQLLKLATKPKNDETNHNGNVKKE